jgi:hypothetical protein
MDDAEFNLLLDKATFKPQTNSVVELYRQRVSSCIVLHPYGIYSQFSHSTTSQPKHVLFDMRAWKQSIQKIGSS